MPRSSRVRELSVVGLIVVIAGVSSSQHWHGRIAWTPDGLFYAAQTLELRGESPAPARHRIFDGSTARPLRLQERTTLPQASRRVDNPEWVSYSAQFYRRRWFVPALAAAIYPWLGLRSLAVVSLIGYVAAGILIFSLLRQRFSRALAAAVATLFLALPSFRLYSFFPLTDSWGVALEVGCLSAALLTMRRGLAYLPLWVIAVAALSLTRDVAIAIVAAAVWLAIRTRTRRNLLVCASGLAAAVPAPLFLGAPLRAQLSWAFDGYHVPHRTSWPNLLHEYGPNLKSMILLDLQHHSAVMLLFAVALVALFGLRRGNDDYFQLVRASAIFSLLYLALVPVYTDFRLELALVPMVAVGVASGLGSRSINLVVPRAVYRSGRRRPGRAPTPATDAES
jgi:hypothetical protein